MLAAGRWRQPTVPSLDAAAFASLRVLHYVNRVGIDQTILSGANAPNPVTQTICASVTSFSPFVLAKAFTALPVFRVLATFGSCVCELLGGLLGVPRGIRTRKFG
jgi:hypothetical protein